MSSRSNAIHHYQVSARPATGDCPAVDTSGGSHWMCTLDTGHDGPHEAWGTTGSTPHRIWTDEEVTP